jgi:hypothetical protein
MKIRALASLVMLFSFILLPLSGIPLHLTGSISLQDPVRHSIMTIHNTSSVIFIIALIIHLVLNWKAIINYMLTKTKEYVKFKKELLVALIIVLGLVGLFTSHVFHLNKNRINYEKQFEY